MNDDENKASNHKDPTVDNRKKECSTKAENGVGKRELEPSVVSSKAKTRLN
eukprot:CAMPEP_0118710092 /NCGR_PEP_ID=MMETSP0800-20121206/23128_1 /TAXON_ID=210618 ORGANISM="Striatella unipunctata, Strain CCMP2910" /NCGR_SAMPLE_ID=MMETSP0800 /ASSEMBLY_ACC=CAM_ASM_000638 /LENGTH=50 /DNA_ID=CAMNT_0006614113 /DNA_START=9 /DNA_END=158 /DNA_ORIENTATION=-